ncbi:MAG: AAA family ATPase [Bacteroidales bacterium]|nr:AAA family ATPase [Bacteroidales bacterium]MCF8397529.1 AAA family ATPase [Bacteroidales bacterium]
MLFYKEKNHDKGDKSQDKYKFKSLQVFNWENQINNKKSYRTVFDRAELTYLGAEFCFYNKKFDESDWKTKVKLVAYQYDNKNKGKKICTIERDVEVPKSENLVVVSEGYGNDDKGEFWKKGNYIWEAFIDGKSVGLKEFLIEDVGVVTKHDNPYFNHFSLKVYEGPDENVSIDQRRYLRVFDTGKTRYIFGELKIVDFVGRIWPCELFFNFFDDTGQLIGQSVFFDFLEPEENDMTYTVTAGWGNQDFNNWKQDDYTVEVVFMDQLVAVLPFSVADYEKEDIRKPDSEDPATEVNQPVEDPDPTTAQDEETTEKTSPANERKSNRELLNKELKKLDELIGLQAVKTKIREHISYIDFLKVRKDLGYKDEEEISLHSVFTGNPGTGKTTVVKLLGQIYKHMGLLSKGHVHTVESTDLISGYIRQTGKDTREHIEKARGGILFIDEAYMLYKKKAENDFGDEAVSAILTEISDGKGDIAIMVAGYPNEMNEFINSNPGLKSRFKNYFHFDDYTPDELINIAQFAARKKNVDLSPEARKLVHKNLIRSYRKRDKTFGNARLAYRTVDEAKMAMGIRVMKKLGEAEINKEVVSKIEAEDIKEVLKEGRKQIIDIPIDEELLNEALIELKQLTGLDNIKQEINDLVKLVRYYRDMKKDFRKAFSIHSVFTGNPGTGKTTVARILGKIYKSLGVLERGHLIETDASDLIAGFIGQTAIKTKERITEAMGGILFIDEAYSITEGRHPDFGKKAVATLLKEMETNRGHFSVIVAGYPRPMKEFIQSNPGLKSRFDQTLVFKDLDAEDLYKIAVGMLASQDLEPDEEAAEHLKKYLEFLTANRNQYFGNARSVRKIIDRAVRSQNLRMAEMKASERSEEKMKTLILDDLREFRIDDFTAFPSIGFRLGKQDEKAEIKKDK